MVEREKGRAPFGVLPFRTLGPGFWLRLFTLGMLDALAIYALPFLIQQHNWLVLAVLILGTAGINYVYFAKRAFPIRWLVPGLFFLLIMMIYPIFYTFWVALHNWSTGHILTKPQVVDLFEQQVFEPEVGERFSVVLYGHPDGDLIIRVEREDGSVFIGVPRSSNDPVPEDDAIDLIDLATTPFVDDDGDGVPESIDGRPRLTLGEVLQIQDVNRLVVDIPDLGEARLQTGTSAKLAEQRFVYDEATSAMLDRVRGISCPADDATGNFVCAGAPIDPGWRVVIGLDNFTDVATDARIREPFVKVFVWNVAFAVIVVTLQLAIGLLLAINFQDRRMRAKKLYRAILILPWAMPAFISVIVWRALLNQRFGKLNDLIEPVTNLFGNDRIPWLTDPIWAKAAVILVTVWLGFPYMFLVASGALQAIPEDLKEAGRVDGATSRQVFWRITFPLLMVSIAPLVIASFGFNFNNFINIFLLTEGGPPLVGYDVPVGHTDILISFTYNLASASGRGQNFGLAAAITFFIFMIVVILSIVSFRFTKKLEEVYGNL
ncbi:MAG: ABC transporter permease subunit [Actinobacteria bacterium]|nr:ABC transporter permease subunit [Actinomycetota bacterium]MBU1494326.1 ABC transporter permease subunit [Actinomycetota bacterium]MBU1866817.1 ABC transporter permease subunit [Actinomycetota bacterium]